ncbi:MAG: shikimate dehydrogenase [Verrucomicrobia bacterium]|nr:shikimate dehydrogenase [Verrucomicrobiota bacterium]
MDTAATYTLADLAAWSHPGVSLAVLGYPIKHSVSPAMHNAALAEMATREASFADWRYVRFEVPPEELPRALALLHEKRFLGVNLTLPHKMLAVAQIAAIDPAAQPVGAVNTLRWRADGWEGFNTDGYGLASGLREDLGVELAGADVILLGAGGAARGAAVECLQRGVRSLWIANRTRENLDALLAQLAPLAGGATLRGFVPAEASGVGLPAGAVVVNATSAGLKAGDPLPIDLAALSKPRAVYDMIYNPAETAFLAAARDRGLPAANGLSMLVHQGARALEIWTGGPVPVAAMAAAARAAMGR